MADDEADPKQIEEAEASPVAAFLIPPDFPQVVEFDFNTLMSYGRLTPEVLASISALLATLQASFLDSDLNVLRNSPICTSHAGCGEHVETSCPPRCIHHFNETLPA